MNHSPVITPAAGSMIIAGQPTLDFYAALKAIADGARITKLEWNDPETYGVLVDGKVMLRKHDADYEFYPWTISDGDIAGTDWVILP